jgi:hypothetical protein
VPCDLVERRRQLHGNVDVQRARSVDGQHVYGEPIRRQRVLPSERSNDGRQHGDLSLSG